MAQDRNGRLVDVTNKGIEFTLYFRDLATKAVEGMSGAMDKMVKGLETAMRKTSSGARSAADMLQKLQERQDRERGMVTPIGASKHAPEFIEKLRLIMERFSTRQIELMQEQRFELERLLGSFTEVKHEGEGVEEQFKETTDQVGKFVDALGKIGVTAYGAKRLAGMFVDWTAEMADARGELERLQIAMTAGTPQIKTWREEARAAAGDLINLTLQTRTTTEEQLQVYRLLMQQNIAFEGLGRRIAEESLKLGKFTQLGAEGFEQMFAYLHKTLEVSENDMPRAMDRMSGAMIIARRNGVASFSEIQEQMNRLSDSATYIYNRLRNLGVGLEEAQHRAMSFTERATAMGTVLREVGVNADVVQSAFNTLTKVGTDEFNRLVTFIAGNSGVAADHIQKMLDSGDPTAFIEALLTTAQNFSGRIGDLTAEAQQKMLGSLGQDIQHLTQITAAQNDKIRDRMRSTFAELDANAKKPVVWQHAWEEFSKTFGQLWERLTAVGRAFKNDLGLTLSDVVLPVLIKVVDVMEYLFITTDKGEKKLSTFGHAMQLAFSAAAIAASAFFGFATVHRLWKLVTGMEEAAMVAHTLGRAWTAARTAAIAFGTALRGLTLASVGAALLNPWIAIPALIIGATILVVKYWDTITEGFEGAKMFVEDLWLGMKDLWNTSLVGQFINTIVSGVGTVISALQEVGKVIIKAVIWPFSKLSELVGGIFEEIWARLPDWGKTLLTLGSNALRMMPGVGPLLQAGDAVAGTASHGRDVRAEQDRLAHIERLVAAGYSRDQAEQFSKKASAVAVTSSTAPTDQAGDMAKAIGDLSGSTQEQASVLEKQLAAQLHAADAQGQLTSATDALRTTMQAGQQQGQQIISAQMLAYQQIQRVLQQSLTNEATQRTGLTDIQRAIQSVAAGMQFKSPEQATPGNPTAAYVAGDGAPPVAIPEPPKQEDFDTRIDYRNALDQWQKNRESLTQKVDQAWSARQQTTATPPPATDPSAPGTDTTQSMLGRQRERVRVDNTDVVGAISAGNSQIIAQLEKLNQTVDRQNAGGGSAINTWRMQQ